MLLYIATWFRYLAVVLIWQFNEARSDDYFSRTLQEWVYLEIRQLKVPPIVLFANIWLANNSTFITIASIQNHE